MGCAIHRDYVAIGQEGTQFNGEMLRMARESEGYTRAELAKATAIPIDRLEAIEKGFSLPSEAEFSRILEWKTSFLKGFYFLETTILEEPLKVFICGEGIEPCSNCGEVADWLCDYPTGKGERCSLPLCDNCRTHDGKHDFCSIHAKMALRGKD